MCQNFDFTRYIKQPSISTSFLSGRQGFRSDSDFPPNVACFHRLPGKHWDYCRGLPSCFWSIHVLSNSRFLQPNSRVLNYEIPWFQLRFISFLGFNIINLLSLNLSAGLMAGSYARGCNWMRDSMLFINLNKPLAALWKPPPTKRLSGSVIYLKKKLGSFGYLEGDIDVTHSKYTHDIRIPSK